MSNILLLAQVIYEKAGFDDGYAEQFLLAALLAIELVVILKMLEALFS